MESDELSKFTPMGRFIRILVLVAFATLQLGIPAVGASSVGGAAGADACGCCVVLDAGCGGCCGSDQGDKPCDSDGDSCECGTVPAPEPTVAFGLPTVEGPEQSLDAADQQRVIDASAQYLESEVWPTSVAASACAPVPRLGPWVTGEPGRIDLEFIQVYRL